MFRAPKNITIATILCCAISAGPLLAQASDAGSPSAEELLEKFNTQVELNATRGLVLAPAEGDDATTESTGTTEVTTASADEGFIQIPQEDQVNIQITFDFDSSALRDDQKPKLATLCQVINNVEIELFRIVGHTDASGAADYNQNLSLLRAQEVKRHMVNDCGVDAARLEAVGVGESFLLDKDDPSSDANRRVEFQALS